MGSAGGQAHQADKLQVGISRAERKLQLPHFQAVGLPEQQSSANNALKRDELCCNWMLQPAGRLHHDAACAQQPADEGLQACLVGSLVARLRLGCEGCEDQPAHELAWVDGRVHLHALHGQPRLSGGARLCVMDLQI